MLLLLLLLLWLLLLPSLLPFVIVVVVVVIAVVVAFTLLTTVCYCCCCCFCPFCFRLLLLLLVCLFAVLAVIVACLFAVVVIVACFSVVVFVLGTGFYQLKWILNTEGSGSFQLTFQTPLTSLSPKQISFSSFFVWYIPMSPTCWRDHWNSSLAPLFGFLLPASDFPAFLATRKRRKLIIHKTLRTSIFKRVADGMTPISFVFALYLITDVPLNNLQCDWRRIPSAVEW